MFMDLAVVCNKNIMEIIPRRGENVAEDDDDDKKNLCYLSPLYPESTEYKVNVL